MRGRAARRGALAARGVAGHHDAVPAVRAAAHADHGGPARLDPCPLGRPRLRRPYRHDRGAARRVRGRARARRGRALAHGVPRRWRRVHPHAAAGWAPAPAARAAQVGGRLGRVEQGARGARLLLPAVCCVYTCFTHCSWCAAAGVCCLFAHAVSKGFTHIARAILPHGMIRGFPCSGTHRVCGQEH